MQSPVNDFIVLFCSNLIRVLGSFADAEVMRLGQEKRLL
ncbi:hypothetical protein SynA1825c_00342 [Synechococcus sp. A18-25c]|nr:hypothetical protein SynA1825c_00342 [Synechococcus sp. A18-25c]